VFYLTLKTLIKICLSSEKILVSSWFQVLGQLFAFLKVINWFNEVSMMFSRCFWVKVGSKWVFLVKKTLLCWPYQWTDSEINKWHIVFFFYKEWATPFTLEKKNPHTGRFFVGMVYQAHSTKPHSFLFSIFYIIFLNYYFLYVFFKIIFVFEFSLIHLFCYLFWLI
jgi:hypothetical protein